ncbi:MAG: BMP family ABC transporter substrate-binding protein [Clostridiales bacterium]|jgi:basic membrane lipoprotein Med (substrate-binding protein (PBP1-ABC) superfamily)|nr:BMP family ABC transporter substrate-binding protein [Clostridiales bacterium]
MRYVLKSVSLLLTLMLMSAVVMSMGGCKGRKNEDPSKSAVGAIAADELKIGLLFPDSANAASAYYYQLKGITSAMEKAGLDVESQLIVKRSVSDVSFDAQKDFSLNISVPSTEQSVENTKESETQESRNAAKKQTALEAAAVMVSDGCNVIVAASDIYAELTEYLAENLSDTFFLQYGKSAAELPNLKSYSDRIYEAFYLAGVAAAKASDEKTAGFICGENNSYVKDYVNAFANGMAAEDDKSSVIFASTGVRLDLVLERTLTERLISEHKCSSVAQSVITALPQVAAESGKVFCFGFGYDMSPDAKEYNVFSVIWKWDVFFEQMIKDITEGSFSSTPYDGGLAEGLVDITKIRTDGDDLSAAVGDAKSKIISGEINPLEGVPSDGGFLKSVKVI